MMPFELEDPLELELVMAVSHLVGAENRTEVFCESSSALNC